MTLLQEGGQPYNPCGFVSDLGPGQGPDPRTKKKIWKNPKKNPPEHLARTPSIEHRLLRYI